MLFDDVEHAWFLAQLKPNALRIAERNLKRQGFSVFCPRERATRRKRGRFTNALQPYFPGYIFVSFDPRQIGWRAINATQGVGRLVSFGDRPAKVPQALMNAPQRRCDAEGVVSANTDLAPGDTVRLTTGPFADILAEVDQIAPDRRVWVLMDMLSGKARVAVNADQLQKAS